MAKTRGFGVLKKRDPKYLKEIASSGGRAAQDKGTGHAWTAEEAREQGKRGGAARWHHKKGDK